MTDNKLPTNEGKKTISEIINSISYTAYASNRDYGCTHEQLTAIGLGNDQFKKQYENEKNNSIQ